MPRPIGCAAVVPVLIALLLAGCGSEETARPGDTSGGTTPSVPSPEQALKDALATYATTTAPANMPAVTGAAGKEPSIAKPQGAPPTKLVIKDLVPGIGQAVRVTDTVTFHYKGTAWDTGAEFDSSWKRGQPAAFALNQLIPGWQIGIPGMKEGGRRQLVIPPDLAYGPAGSGHELAGKTLVFVIDVVRIGS